ncbi:hypothetical protein SNK03_13553 [Fusarium graminearum]|uniref:Chromosome 1, complete genome n=1 Tax=Gibberella zeae (strain ATCC MYA-4620 / CBS 123657 / FGSC 9075 / NRRL 31084 / PH-1) TaxID=229533 RepID=I1S4M2_GIBZE|nr:hypothetical protein FGSG_11790 [Fusarium graminearum PH-1]ESU05798.1 hypothetical protein FGSG_11790 [Fusarium graminearum PH-1]EYB25655.1 hypothetical protein FG05_11790 [Fusarium graminearum]CEF72558.1 unnamed protein product [Fusarium graminearum]CZS75822.1 unnamed protein product [Fusarium graminearum]|eukprot:XP_011316283.1 hypothetical protein FGSG_11790 [Fusarium graminearum PH-1]
MDPITALQWIFRLSEAIDPIPTQTLISSVRLLVEQVSRIFKIQPKPSQAGPSSLNPCRSAGPLLRTASLVILFFASSAVNYAATLGNETPRERLHAKVTLDKSQFDG